MRIAFLLFIVIPVVEMWLLIQVGGLIGAWPTIGLVLLTALAGAALLRREGVKTLLRARQQMEQGVLPAAEMLEGMILAISGALLLTPGFATDFFGLLGLIPWSRRALAARILAHAEVVGFAAMGGGAFRRPDDSIDGEFWNEQQSQQRKPLESQNHRPH